MVSIYVLISFGFIGAASAFLSAQRRTMFHESVEKPTRTLFSNCLNTLRMGKSYLDDLNVFKPAEKRVLVGFSTDSWAIGQRKYKELLAVHKMATKIQKMKIACVEVPVFEIAQGPHYDELQRLLESFWIPDFTTTEQFLLQFDLIVVPDPVLAKYLVEAYFDKEAKVEKKKQYYAKLIKQPFGVLEAFPPKERYEYERIKNLSKQKWIRKFPPLATCGTETYDRLKNHAQIEYHSDNVEDFALYLPEKMVPNKKVLVLRYKNRFETMVQSLVLKGIDCTSAYPVTYLRKDWSPQEERYNYKLYQSSNVALPLPSYHHDRHTLLTYHLLPKPSQGWPKKLMWFISTKFMPYKSGVIV